MTSTAQAQSADGFGLGVVLGDPTGLTFKNWFDSSNALAGHLAFDFGDDNFTAVAEYQIHFDAFNVRSPSIDLPLYVGIGGKVVGTSDVAIGPRVPIGLAFLLKKAPLGFFVEGAVGMYVIPATDVFLDGALGARYYF